MKSFWDSLGRGSKLGLSIGILTILIATSVAAFFLFKVEYQVLFSDLKAQDSAVMVAELEKQKIPYRMSDSGDAILVEKSIVHATRMKLLGKDLPLHGAVGFELFNANDFGMTEFAQKINYQRALQGEITRTILSFDEVKDVRVHLALPEEGLFKRATSKPKAAITIGLKQGARLRPEQVSGIQRLVAAAVPGIVASDVVVSDQHGIILSRSDEQSEIGQSHSALELKKEMESALTKKANDILARVFGDGKVTASVDVVLNMDQVKVTTEDILPAQTATGNTFSGVLVKSKETSNESGAVGELRGGDGGRQVTSQRESEYQVGRRVEQVIGQTGAIKRLSAVAVVERDLSDEQREQVRDLLLAAVGAIPDRGDSVVVQTALLAKDATMLPNENLKSMPSQKSKEDSSTLENTRVTQKSDLIVYVLTGVLVFISFSILIIMFFRKRSTHVMDEKQRMLALAQIQEWLDADEQDLDMGVHQSVVNRNG